MFQAPIFGCMAESPRVGYYRRTIVFMEYDVSIIHECLFAYFHVNVHRGCWFSGGRVNY